MGRGLHCRGELPRPTLVSTRPRCKARWLHAIATGPAVMARTTFCLTSTCAVGVRAPVVPPRGRFSPPGLPGRPPCVHGPNSRQDPPLADQCDPTRCWRGGGHAKSRTRSRPSRSPTEQSRRKTCFGRAARNAAEVGALTSCASATPNNVHARTLRSWPAWSRSLPRWGGDEERGVGHT